MVSGHISHYDSEAERSFVTIQAALLGPGLMFMLGITGVFIFLMALSRVPMAPSAACNLLVLIGIPIIGGMFYAKTFDSNRRQTLEIVTNHLMKLQQSKPLLNSMIDHERYK